MVDSDTLMRSLALAARTAARDLTREIEPEGLFGAEWATLALLHRTGPVSQATLAEGLAIEPPAISKALARLEAKGWVQRSPGPTRREYRVALTGAAEEHFPRWAARVGAHHARALAGLAEGEKAQLQALLERLLGNLQEPPGA